MLGFTGLKSTSENHWKSNVGKQYGLGRVTRDIYIVETTGLIIDHRMTTICLSNQAKAITIPKSK